MIEQTGAELRDEGMQRAIDAAGAEDGNWPEMALDALKSFAEGHGKPFMAEEAREWAVWLPKPKSKRAWGAVLRKAARMGIIRKVGQGAVMNPMAHMAIANRWIWGRSKDVIA